MGSALATPSEESPEFDAPKSGTAAAGSASVKGQRKRDRWLAALGGTHALVLVPRVVLLGLFRFREVLVDVFDFDRWS